MAEYQYSITTDFPGTWVKTGELYTATQATAWASKMNYISQHGDLVCFLTHSDLTAGEKTELDGIIAAHNHGDLEKAKEEKYKAINTVTNFLISQGCPFGGKVFALDTDTKLNWVSMYVFKDMLTWPMDVSTADETQFTFTDATHFTQFVGTCLTFTSTVILGGRALKDAVEAATTVAEVDAVVDNRI